MSIRHFLANFIVMGLALPFTPVAAIAGPTGFSLGAQGEFQVLQASATPSRERHYRLIGSGGSDRFRLHKLRAQWTYDLGEGGPIVVVAALGGRKGTPKLAHVRLAWHF